MFVGGMEEERTKKTCLNHICPPTYPPKKLKQQTEPQHEGRCYMAQAARDILRACAESGGVDPATGRYREPIVKLSRCVCVYLVYICMYAPRE